MKDETQLWLKYADGDLGAASVLMTEGYYSAALLHCEQAVEKLLKAFWVEARGPQAVPRIHDLVQLAEIMSPPLDESQLLLLRRLAEQYIPLRYPTELGDYTVDDADDLFRATGEFYSWLRPQLS